MRRLTSADKGRTDGEASFRYSEKNETGSQSVPVTAELLPALKVYTFRLGATVDNSFPNVVHKGVMGISCCKTCQTAV